jgi:hypothetical protein
MKFTTSFIAFLFFASSAVLAAPVQLAARDVWVPEILQPTEGATWQVGETYSVEWATDEKPEQVTNPVGTVYLSKNGTLDIGE